VRLDNPQLRLKPGMFARISLVLDRVAEAAVVPEQALVTRDGHSGLFVVAQDAASVVWREVTVGIRQGDRVQVSAENLAGRVVILGQQLLKDGSRIAIAGEAQAVTP
jgi:multidrug efflux pump subunit AcrA (membrane-fusion protein)